MASSHPLFPINRMADQNFCGISRVHQSNRSSASKKRKQSVSLTAAVRSTARNIEQFSDVLELVALTHLYMEMSLPLPAALRAAKADLLTLAVAPW
jgi:hypothetical protein